MRFIGNRSSGRMGIALAEVAAEAGWDVTLLLGPTHLSPTCSSVRVEKFRTAADLRGLLARHQPGCDVLIMGAAVADFTPKPLPGSESGKVRRSAGPVTLELEPTPDLLAECATRRAPGQILVGFALEPESRLMESALSKLERKRVDMIVANPLETMDAPTIRATVVRRSGPPVSTPGAVSKDAFAEWLLGVIASEPGQDSTK